MTFNGACSKSRYPRTGFCAGKLPSSYRKVAELQELNDLNYNLKLPRQSGDVNVEPDSSDRAASRTVHQRHMYTIARHLSGSNFLFRPLACLCKPDISPKYRYQGHSLGTLSHGQLLWAKQNLHSIPYHRFCAVL